jgi:hypothetical protein
MTANNQFTLVQVIEHGQKITRSRTRKKCKLMAIMIVQIVVLFEFIAFCSFFDSSVTETISKLCHDTVEKISPD